MAVRIANLKILISASTRGLVTGFNNASRSVQTFRKRVTGLLFSVKGLAVGLTALVGVTLGARAAILSMNRQFVNLDKLAKTASKIGVTTQALEKMRFAAKLSGVEVNTTDMALQRFIRRTAEAAAGTGEALKAFQELEIDAKVFSKLSLEDQMRGLADAMQRFSDSDQLRIAFKLFDSEGAALVNTLKGGSAALDEIFKERIALGLFTDAQLRRIERANDAMAKIGIQIDFIKGAIAIGLAPVITELSVSLSGLTTDSEKLSTSITNALRSIASSFAFVTDAINTARAAIGIFGLQLSAAGAQFSAAALILGGADTEDPSNLLGKIKSFLDETEAEIATLEGQLFGTDSQIAVDEFFDRVDQRIADAAGKAERTIIPGDPAGGAGAGAGGLKALLPQARLQGSAAAASFIAQREAKEGPLIALAKKRNDELEIISKALDEFLGLTPKVELAAAALGP